MVIDFLQQLTFTHLSIIVIGVVLMLISFYILLPEEVVELEVFDKESIDKHLDDDTIIK